MSISRHVLHPIIPTTFAGALDSLQKAAESLSVSSSADGQTGSNLTPDEMKRLCLTAIEVISDIVNNHSFNQNFQPWQHQQQAQPLPTIPNGAHQFTPQPHSKRCSGWLHEYLARLLSISPSRPFRRVAMSFLFRVPLSYPTTIQGILDSLPLSLEKQGPMLAALSLAETLLLDIHAHWLVLTLSLNGFWFFGRAGVWELGRIVESVRSRRLVFQYRADDAGEGW